MPEILKNSSDTGDLYTVMSHLHNCQERTSVRPGNKQLSRRFPGNVHSP